MNGRLPGRVASTLAALAVALAASLLPAAGGPPAHAAPAAQPAPRFFPETGFGIDNDAFFSYFQGRGGVATFGFPVSREFKLEGFQLQLFQRGVMQLAPEGGVRLLNLLDQQLRPVTSVNSSQFPAWDPEVAASTPAAGAPDYAQRMAEFVRANVPDQFEGLPVSFQRTFLQAAGSIEGDPVAGTLLSLEIWGAPTSRPARDPGNRGFVYQRFQRGVMHFDASTGATEGLLVGDWFKSVLTGRGLPADLESQMRDSPYLRQYVGDGTQGSTLPDSDLAGAFEPQQPPPVPVGGPELLYPDLRSLPPEDLDLGIETVGGVPHHVIRFGTTIWNAGEGPMEIRGVMAEGLEAHQWIYDAEGGFVERPAGNFVFHEAHGHWHLEGYARYQLWARASFDSWQAGNRTLGEPEWQREKAGFCLMDTYRVMDLPGSPPSAVYPPLCEPAVQGISVGWGDVYPVFFEGQSIDLGTEPLPDGQYVLRTVADPLRQIHESEGGADPSRDSDEANESLAVLAVEGGRIVAVAR